MKKEKVNKRNIESPSFLKVSEDADVKELIMSKLGIEPNASGSKRRWHFLRIMARHIYEQKAIGLNDFFKWTTANCQCMKMRTLRDDYLDTLERVGLIKFDLNTGKIEWNGEGNG